MVLCRHFRPEPPAGAGQTARLDFALGALVFRGRQVLSLLIRLRTHGALPCDAALFWAGLMLTSYLIFFSIAYLDYGRGAWARYLVRRRCS